MDTNAGRCQAPVDQHLRDQTTHRMPDNDGLLRQILHNSRVVIDDLLQP